VPELENRNRLTVGSRIILVIPQAIVLALLVVAAFVAWVIAFFAVLFTGRWPEGLRSFVVGVMRWGTGQRLFPIAHRQVPAVQPGMSGGYPLGRISPAAASITLSVRWTVALAVWMSGTTTLPLPAATVIVSPRSEAP
jgi:hypothetical protein